MRLLMLLVLGAVISAQQQQQPQRNYKNRQEYDLYTEITKDFSASNFADAIGKLGEWSDKYPESEFKSDRQMLLVHAYVGANQPSKVLDAAKVALADKGLNSADPGSVARLLYDTAFSIRHVADPSSEQLATGEEAAKRLENFDTAPSGVSEAAWASTRTQLHSAARSALVYIAVVPASRAIKANDCRGGEELATKAINEFPDSVQAAWFLGVAEVCNAKTDPEKASIAIYLLARAAALDPAKGMVDPKWQQSSVAPYLEKLYEQFHGQDPQGLKELKELAVQSPFPPSGFRIRSAAELEQARDADFEAKHPELALWKRIKSALEGDEGEHYFESDLRDAAVPELQGVVLGAKPECRPTELHVGVRFPEDSGDLREEIVLKLQRPFAGKPNLGSEVHWTGVPTAFSRTPFLLTIDVDPAKLKDLQSTPCQATGRAGMR